MDSIMRKIILLALSFVLMVSCQRRASVLHVVSADSCDDPAVIGTIGTKEYALSVADPKSDLACQSVIGTKAVGKDFPVTMELGQGLVKVTVLPDANGGNQQTTIAVYRIEHVRDFNR